MSTVLAALAKVRKALAAAAGLAAMGITSGLFDGTALAVAQAIVAIATVLGVYSVPNAKGPEE